MTKIVKGEIVKLGVLASSLALPAFKIRNCPSPAALTSLAGFVVFYIFSLLPSTTLSYNLLITSKGDSSQEPPFLAWPGKKFKNISCSLLGLFLPLGGHRHKK